MANSCRVDDVLLDMSADEILAYCQQCYSYVCHESILGLCPHWSLDAYSECVNFLNFAHCANYGGSVCTLFHDVVQVRLTGRAPCPLCGSSMGVERDADNYHCLLCDYRF